MRPQPALSSSYPFRCADPAVEAVLGSPASTLSREDIGCPNFPLADASPLPVWPEPPLSLVWFRGHDLRVRDHPALDAAVTTRGPVVALYVLERGAENDGTVLYPRRRHPYPTFDENSFSSSIVSSCSNDSTDAPGSTHPAPQNCNSPDVVSSAPAGPISPNGDFSLGQVPSWYLHHSLLVLQQSLHELGITLILRRVDEPTHTVDQVFAVAASLSAGAVFWNKRNKPNAYPVDEAVRERLSQRNIFVRDFHSETLMPPDLSSCGPFSDFQSYTRFCISSLRQRPPPRPSNPLSRSDVQAMNRRTVKNLLARFEPDYLRHSPIPASMSRTLPDVEDFELLDGLVIDGRTPPGDVRNIGCVAAENTLRTFLSHERFQRFAHDDARRDGMVIGDDLATSRLSPHIRFGEISPRVLFYAVVDEGAHAFKAGNLSGLRAARTFVKNMTLREFGYYMLVRFPCAAHKPIMPEFEVFPWAEDEDGVKQKAWERGTTGFPIIDAAMRQLWREGWLHNKMRFLVASFFCKYLLLPWPSGAAYLVRALIDGDEASNSLGWQWTAGCNTDSFPFSTLVNPISFQTQAKSIHRAAQYIRKYVPELSKFPDELIFTPWKATDEELRKYNLMIAPIEDYNSWACCPPIEEGEISSIAVYPKRIIDVKDARARSRYAMDVMRRIFSSQRQHHTVIVDQSGPDSNETYCEQYRGGRRRIRTKIVCSEDGSEMNEIDLTEDCSKSDDSILSFCSKSTNSSRKDCVTKRAYSASIGRKGKRRGDSKRRKRDSSASSISQFENHYSRPCDLLALCEVANRNTIPGNETVQPLQTSKDPITGIANCVKSNTPPLERRQERPMEKRQARGKRTRRTDCQNPPGKRLSVQSLLSANQATTSAVMPNSSPSSAHALPHDAEIRPNPAVGGLPGLAQVASTQKPLESDAMRVAPVSMPPSLTFVDAHRAQLHNVNGPTNGQFGETMNNPLTSSRFAMPSSVSSRKEESLLTGNSPSAGLKQITHAGTNVMGTENVSMSNLNGYNHMTGSNTHRLASVPPFKASVPSVPDLYQTNMAPVPVVQNPYSPLATPHQNQPQQLLMPYRHPNAPMAISHIPPPLAPLHGSQAYFPSPGNVGASQTGPQGHPFIWYPPMHSYVDIHTGLPSSTPVLPHMIPMQHTTQVPVQYAGSGIGNTNTGVLSPYDQSHKGHPSAVSNPTALVAQRTQGPNTPLEREAIARRMAAMDYHDETYGGKHWEQWQAIALHLLNCYEFSEDTDRETSRDYVRLCVLKDELRDANPSGPRVTVNHCKEVFKILRLPVTGEWDRRGHGGVRGPYVYGCSKRNIASDTHNS